jgi:hypothetical protein
MEFGTRARTARDRALEEGAAGREVEDDDGGSWPQLAVILESIGGRGATRRGAPFIPGQTACHRPAPGT